MKKVKIKDKEYDVEDNDEALIVVLLLIAERLGNK